MLPTINAEHLTVSTVYFLPELLLCAAVVLLLLLRLFRAFDRTHLGGLALLLTLCAGAVSVAQWRDAGDTILMFELLVYDYFTLYVRIFLFGFTALVIWLTMLTGIPDREDSADFYCLLLGAVMIEGLAQVRFGVETPSGSDRFILDRDWRVYVAASLFAVLAAGIASVIPARRASRLDPVQIVRGAA